jgi:hypothetical protein
MSEPRVNKIDKLKLLKQRLFVRYYTGSLGDPECFGNATRSYMRAYGYWDKLMDIEDKIGDFPMSEREETFTVGDKTETVINPKYKKLLDQKQKWHRTCEVHGSRLMSDGEVYAACQDEFLRVHDDDSLVDTELGWLIRQREHPQTKVAAIRELNKKKGRIIDKLDLTSQGEKVGVVYLPDRNPAPEPVVEPPKKKSTAKAK